MIYNGRNISFSANNISFAHVMASIDFTYDQSAIWKVIWGYIYT